MFTQTQEMYTKCMYLIKFAGNLQKIYIPYVYTSLCTSLYTEKPLEFMSKIWKYSDIRDANYGYITFVVVDSVA